MLASASAAQRAGMELEGFRIPDYNEDGTMKSQLFGGRAVLMDDEKVEITDLKIEFYDVGKSNVVVTAPHCSHDRQSRDAESAGPVKIDMQELTITGQGFTCSGTEYRFTILNNAKVVLKDVRLGLKGVE
jgi:hypothetical protein